MAKMSKSRRGRQPLFANTAKIRVLVRGNPHRTGTDRFRRWGNYQNGMTVAKALEAGFNYANLRFSVADGHIAIV